MTMKEKSVSRKAHALERVASEDLRASLSYIKFLFVIRRGRSSFLSEAKDATSSS